MKLPNRRQIIGWLGNITEKGLVLLVIGYIIFSVGRSVMKNYTMNQKIAGLEAKIAALDQEKSYLTNLIAYYKTDTFKELKTREELGFLKPGEKVISVPVEPDDIPNGERSDFVVAVQPDADDQPLPNYQKWYNYFFN